MCLERIYFDCNLSGLNWFGFGVQVVFKDDVDMNYSK